MIPLVLTTFANPSAAEGVVRTLVEERLAACGTLLPGARSIFRWKDAIEESAETVVLFKTTIERHDDLVRRLKELHPYETPEIISLDPAAVSGEYAAWVQACTQTSPSG